ncbi:MAG: hypothetical protein IIA44_14405 [Acidobacteria bacterium]|nr:hypothetical protein [Acidobacteriota bacterium]
MSDEPRRLTPTPYGRHLGLEVLEADRGIATVRLELAEHICNRRGVAHGGALAHGTWTIWPGHPDGNMFED